MKETEKGETHRKAAEEENVVESKKRERERKEKGREREKRKRGERDREREGETTLIQFARMSNPG